MLVGNIDPYTKAMINCLEQFPKTGDVPELDERTSQFLANMIQGRFLRYLVSRICHTYQIVDKELEKQLIMEMMTLLSDKFFAVFREKVKAKPEIVYIIAKKITSTETRYSTQSKRVDALFRGISRRYFDYQNFRIILRWINSNPVVERIVFIAKIQKGIKDSALVKALLYILHNDKEGITPKVFNRYLDKEKIDRLNGLVKSGDWKIEADFVRYQSAMMINWREYMRGM